MMLWAITEVPDGAPGPRFAWARVYAGSQTCSKVATRVKKGVQGVPNGTEMEAKMSKMDPPSLTAPTFAPPPGFHITSPRPDRLPIQCSFSLPDCRP